MSDLIASSKCGTEWCIPSSVQHLDAWCEIGDVTNPASQQKPGGAALLPVEPDAEIVQGCLGGQSGLKAVQLVRSLPVQAEGIVELVKDRFHDMAYPSQPAAQSLGPRGLAVAFGRRDQPGAVAVLPPLMLLPSLEAVISHIPAGAGSR